VRCRHWSARRRGRSCLSSARSQNGFLSGLRAACPKSAHWPPHIDRQRSKQIPTGIGAARLHTAVLGSRSGIGVVVHRATAAMSSSQQQAPNPNAVPDTQLGLTEDQVELLRHGQQAVAAAGPGSTSSRAASRASSQGLLLMDTSSLTALGRHFDRVMQSIQQRLEYLMEQSQIVTLSVYDRAGNLIDNADAEIARYHDIMAQIDELELDFDRIAQIREIVRGFRQRAEELERELERSGGSSSSKRDRHGHSSHRSHGHSSSGRRRA